MATRDHNGRTVVLVGGMGLLAWWLLSRGKGWGFRGPDNGKNGAVGDTTRPLTRCVVWVRGDRIEVDRVAMDLPTAIAKCRVAGEAEVHATGDAIMRSVARVVNGLRAAGVTVYLSPDLARTTWDVL